MIQSGQELSIDSNNELVLFKRVLVFSIFAHLVILFVEPSLFFFNKTLNENTIEVELLAFETNNNKTPSSPITPPPAETAQLPQVTKRFAIEQAKNPDEMALEEQKEPVKKDPKIFTKMKKDEEDLTKIALDRLIKEVNRKTTKDKIKSNLVHYLSERKKELEANHMQGMLSLGESEAGYAAVVKGWIQKHYSLPDIYELKNSHIKAVVQLVLNQQGGIAKLSLISSSQNELFDQLALKTIENASPFPAPPQDWVGKAITLPFEIN